MNGTPHKSRTTLYCKWMTSRLCRKRRKSSFSVFSASNNHSMMSCEVQIVNDSFELVLFNESCLKKFNETVVFWESYLNQIRVIFEFTTDCRTELRVILQLCPIRNRQGTVIVMYTLSLWGLHQSIFWLVVNMTCNLKNIFTIFFVCKWIMVLCKC